MPDPIKLKAAEQQKYDSLLKVRASKTCTLKPTPLLAKTIKGLDGQTAPFKLRYYQVQGAYHMIALKRMILGDATGLGKCVTGETLIWTDGGLVPIESLAPGGPLPNESFHDPARPARVWTGVHWASVRRFFWNGEAETRRLTSHGGLSVEGSLNHPVKVRTADGESFCKLSELEGDGGEWLCVARTEAPFPEADPELPGIGPQHPNAKTYSYPAKLTPDLARLLGYVVGESWGGHRYFTPITQHAEVNPEAHADIRQLLESVFGWVGSDNAHDRDREIRVHSVAIRSFLQGCGIGNELSAGKTVPWPILRGSRESAREFLRGLFEGEGSALKEGGVEFSSASRELVRVVQLLLLRFGIVSRRARKKVKGRSHVYWKLTFFGRDATLFRHRIGFVSERKTQALDEGLAAERNLNKDVVPFMGPTVADLKQALLAKVTVRGANEGRKGSGLKQFGRSFESTLSHVTLGLRNPTYRFLDRLLAVCKEHGLVSDPAYRAVAEVVDQHYFYDPITAIDDGFAPVMDIEVDDPEHCFSGNGVLNHNTVEAITAMAQVLTVESSTRWVVVAPKSALYQWASEIERFTAGQVEGIVVETPKAATGKARVQARADAYRRWLEAMNAGKHAVLIMNYATLIRDWNHGAFQPALPNGKPDPKAPVKPGLLDRVTQAAARRNLGVIFDECFDYNTPVTLADGSTELIGKIVCSKAPVEVQSWNFEKGCVETRKVVSWFRNPLRDRHLLKVSFRYANSCRVTKSHEFYKTNGKPVRAGKLKPGSETAFLSSTVPSPDQEQVVLGSLLGDACIRNPEGAWGVTFTQGEDQLEYLDFKRDTLSSLGVSDCNSGPSGYNPDKTVHHFRLGANPSLNSRHRLHDGARKTVTIDWLDAVQPLGLAVWYGDDGSLGEHRTKEGVVRRHIILNTQGFTKAENDLLAGWLRWRWGVKARVRPSRKGFYLYLPHAAAERFLGLLPGALPGVECKFPDKEPLPPLDREARTGLVRDEVVEVSPWARAPKKRDCQQYVYDIEVEGNHNYFAAGTLVSNCQAFKNMRTKTWETCRYLADRSDRVYGLSATIIKNRLEEAYSIFKCIKPKLFTTKTAFLEDYCYTQLQPVAGGRKVPIVVGYKNLKHFRDRIDPFYLGRLKHEVSDELPVLTTREVRVTLSKAEESKYKEALTGVLELGDGDVRDYEEHKALVALTYCQQVVDSLALLKFDEGDEVGFDQFDLETGDYKTYKVGSLSSKEGALVDLLTGELDEQNVIIYTRFERWVSRLQAILAKNKIESVRITGKESDAKVRRAAQEAFQDPDSPVRVCIITNAGSEAINLQTAVAEIFLDNPYSWGDYVQTIGRMIRIGSPHRGVLVYHFIAERPLKKDTRTIDDHVLDLLQKKKDLVDKVLGEAAVGALEFDPDDGSTVRALIKALGGKGEDAKKGKRKK